MRTVGCAFAVGLVMAALGRSLAADTPPRATLRVAYVIAPNTLDPARAGDVDTQAIAGTLFDQLYTYDYLVRPLRLLPLAASDLPSVSSEGRELTIRIRPGIYFTPHRAFGGARRELVAADVVYSLKRFMDPVVRAPVMSFLAGKIVGLDEQFERATREHLPFNYDVEVPGLVAIDRYTVRIALTRPDPTFVHLLANPDFSIVPREAVEADGDDFARHPTGSGPYVVREFQPQARVVLERNPSYRAMRWKDVATPASTDAEWPADLRARRFPLPDRVEWIAMPEATAQLLALERGEIDVIRAPGTALENGRLLPRLARSGIKLVRAPDTWVNWFSFNMQDAQVGGRAPAQVALRRAMAMAIDDDEYIRVLMHGSGAPPRYWIPPGIGGHDPAYRYPIRYDPASANALLDRFGYRTAADGYRRRPDGGDLSLRFVLHTTSQDRELAEFLKRCFDRVRIRVTFEPVAHAVDFMAACRYQLGATGGWIFDWPDGSNLMLAFLGRSNRDVNEACMEDREFDALYDRLMATPSNADRAAVYRSVVARLDMLTPVRLLPVREEIYLTGPNIRGLVIHPALRALYPYLDVQPKSK